VVKHWFYSEGDETANGEDSDKISLYGETLVGFVFRLGKYCNVDAMNLLLYLLWSFNVSCQLNSKNLTFITKLSTELSW
jgi:hypothetical protein